MTSKTYQWGVIGPGKIARKVVAETAEIPAMVWTSVLARSAEKATAFATEMNLPRSHNSLKEFLADPQLDAVYIATPHSSHKELAIACLRAGKAVLCEKPMTLSEADTAAVIDTARRNKVFLMEAVKTYFLPLFTVLRERIRQGEIGSVKVVDVAFGFPVEYNPESRLFKAELGGGALYDLGVYPISLFGMLLGHDPDSMAAVAHLAPNGVDQLISFHLDYPGSRLGRGICSFGVNFGQWARIYGMHGMIEIPGFLDATRAVIEGRNGVREVLSPESGHFRFEFEEVLSCLNRGVVESEICTWGHSIRCARWQDDLLKKVGYGKGFPAAGEFRRGEWQARKDLNLE